MIQGGEGPRFAVEAYAPLRVAGEKLRQDLQGHVTPEFRVACAIDFAHAASTCGGEHFIRTEAGANRKRHRGK